MTTSESEALKALVASSGEELEYIDMLSGNLVGQLLRLLIRISGARRVLEVGTFAGYSALTMAEALPDDGEVITIELNKRYQEIAEQHFRTYDREQKIRFVKGNAQDEIPLLKGKFDLVFIDADKMRYTYYYEQVIGRVKSGGLIVADNVLWNGEVLDPQDKKSLALHDFNAMICEDSRVEQVLLPIRDGLLVVLKS